MDVGTMLMKFATPEVLQVLAAIATAFAGWFVTKKVATGAATLGKGLLQRSTFGGTMSAAMLLAGLSGVGLGTGELMSRWGSEKTTTSKAEEVKSAHVGISDDVLLQYAKQTEADPQTISALLEYAKERDRMNDAHLTKHIAKQADVQANVKPEAKYSESEVAEMILAAKNESKNNSESASDQKFEVAEIQPTAELNSSESIMTVPVAWFSIIFGLGALIVSNVSYQNRRDPLPKA